jgi:S-adenosylmethionine:tRNA ribosyltransferase-isomerase
MRAVRVDEFDYELPPELIAQFPVENRAGSRLMCLDAGSGRIDDRRFADLPEYLTAGDVIVLNDTRVIKARLFGRKDTGGQVEVLVQRILSSNSALATIRASHAPRAGQTIRFSDAASATVEGRQADLFQLAFDDDVTDVLERLGNVPLPPYIERALQDFDGERYQTVYARVPGAVAAPTAGLHFDEAMLAGLKAAGIRIAHVTLHVGAGTFQPVRVDEIEAHVMHSEWYSVPDETAEAIASARAAGRRVLAVGTTSLRALESAAQSGELRAGSAETRLFVTPGFRFRVVDTLLTNFHLPRSTLMMLVSAFGGMDNIRHAYRHAVDERYRFFSYGDAMLIRRAQTGT